MAYQPVVLEDAKRAELEEKHGDVLVLQGTERSPWVVVLRPCNARDVDALRVAKARDATTANEVFVRRVAVFPEAEDFERQVARWPMLCDGIYVSDAFKEWAGLVADEVTDLGELNGAAKLAEDHDVVAFCGRGPKRWTAVLRRPTRQETIGFKQALKQEQGNAGAKLLKRICLHPAGADFDRQLEEVPFFPDGIAEHKAFREFVGVAIDVQGKG